MLKTYPERDSDDGAFDGCRWIDLIDPTDEKADFVARTFTIDIPTLPDLQKIEATSRLRTAGDTSNMSAPLLSGTDTDHWAAVPLAFSPSQFPTFIQ